MRIKHHMSGLLCGVFFALTLVTMMGCEQTTGAPHAVPAEAPDVVLKRFYDYISEAKLKGGASPAREAFKLIDSERSQLIVEQFLEVVKKYPPGFQAEVGKAEIHGSQATVPISYKIASSFGGFYTVNEVIPLVLDERSNSWKVDFTGETYGMDKAAAEASYQEVARQGM